MTEQVLLVDDEPNVLQALKRQLRGEFSVQTAESGVEAIELLEHKGPFAVVVSDMQMPRMNGVELLAAAAQLSPDTVRVMLTGNADQQTAAAAVNTGSIFRFVNKPCPGNELAKTIAAACEHHRLLVSEKTLIQKTLTGSIKVLTDILALANPTAFGCTARLRPIVRLLSRGAHAEPLWECELAAMLCHVGCVAIPEDTLARAFTGKPLSISDQAAFNDHPRLGARLIRNISRLEGVATAVELQHALFAPKVETAESVSQPTGIEIPIAARILRIALDYDTLRQSGLAHNRAIERMTQRTGWYDPELLEILATSDQLEPKRTLASLRIRDLREGMILADHVFAEDGSILVGKGQTVTETLLLRLASCARSRGIREPVQALVFEDNLVTV